MAADLEDVLRGAAAAPPRELDLEAVLTVGTRRRRRRRVLQASSLTAVVVLAAVAVMSAWMPRVELAAPGPGIQWPVAVRYTLHTAQPERSAHERILEFSANGWDDWALVWALVSDSGDGRVIIERFGPARRDSGGEIASSSLLDTPFAALDAAGDATLTWDAAEPSADGRAPGPLLNPRFAGLLQWDHGDGAVMTEDLPDLRAATAAALGLDAADLRSARIEVEGCAGSVCGSASRTSVWLPGIDLPLYAEEVDADGSSQLLVATHLRLGQGPPPNTVPAPPPLDPDQDPFEVPAPVEAGGLWWPPTGGIEFALGQGSRTVLEVSTTGSNAVTAPMSLVLARWDGERWQDTAELVLHHSTEDWGAQPPRATTIRVEPGTTVALQVLLPDEVDPGAHRLSTPDGTVVSRFWYAGDPNRHLRGATEPPPD
jgi:hypothetical protein